MGSSDRGQPRWPHDWLGDGTQSDHPGSRSACATAEVASATNVVIGCSRFTQGVRASILGGAWWWPTGLLADGPERTERERETDALQNTSVVGSPRTAAGSSGGRGEGGKRPQRSCGPSRGCDLSSSRGGCRPGLPGGRSERRSRRRRRDGGQSDGRRLRSDLARRQQGRGSPGDEGCRGHWRLRAGSAGSGAQITKRSNRRPAHTHKDVGYHVPPDPSSLL
jgi:hypothetical protein